MAGCRDLVDGVVEADMFVERRLGIAVAFSAGVLGVGLALWAYPRLQLAGRLTEPLVAPTDRWTERDYEKAKRRARWLIEEGYPIAALELGEQLVAWSEADAEVWRWMGRGYQARGDFKRAAQAWEQAAFFAPYRGRVLFHQAGCLVMLGERAAALDLLEEAIASGFSDLSEIEASQELFPLRGEARFERIREDLRKRIGSA